MGSFEGDVELQTPNRWIRPLGVAAIIFGLVLSIAMGIAAGAPGLGAPFIALGFFAALSNWGRYVFAKKRRAQVRVDVKGIHADGKLVVARGAIEKAYAQPRGGESPVVRVVGRKKSQSADLIVRDQREADEVLKALELDVSHRAISFRGASPVFATRQRQILSGVMTALMMFGLTALGRFAGIIMPLGAFVPFLFFALALASSTITIGVDGVLTSWFGIKRFYRYDDIDAVTPYENGITLLLKSGASIDVPTAPAGRRYDTPVTRMRRDAIFERIEEARRAFTSHHSVEASALCARGGRPIDAWLGALRELATGGYREAAVPRDALWRLAEDPTAEPSARTGAVIALRVKVDDEERARLKTLAEAAASPKVRVALEAAATEDDHAVTEALEELEAEKNERA